MIFWQYITKSIKPGFIDKWCTRDSFKESSLGANYAKKGSIQSIHVMLGCNISPSILSLSREKAVDL